MFSQGNRGLLRLRHLPRAPSRWWQSQNMNPGPGFTCPEKWPEPDQATFLDSSGLTYRRHLQVQRPGRVLETMEEPSLHLGFCECGYEVVCLVCKKKKKVITAVWNIHLGSPRDHGSITRAAGPPAAGCPLCLVRTQPCWGRSSLCMLGRPLTVMTWHFQVAMATTAW